VKSKYFTDNLEDDYLPGDRRYQNLHKRVLSDIFTAAGIFDQEKGFLPEVIVSAASLSGFITKCERHKQKLEGKFELALRSDWRLKPTQQLGLILNLVGLSLHKVRTVNQGGKKLYLYTLDKNALSDISTIVERRKSMPMINARSMVDIEAEEQEREMAKEKYQ